MGRLQGGNLEFPALPDKGAGARTNKAAVMLDGRRFTHRLPLALLLALFSGVSALARNVECPAVWPGDSSKSRDVVYDDYIDLQCLYTIGRLCSSLYMAKKRSATTFLRCPSIQAAMPMAKTSIFAPIAN